MRDMKFNITGPEHSIKVQNALFKLGYYWNTRSSATGVIPSFIDSPHIYTSSRGVMTYESVRDYFFIKDKRPEYVLLERRGESSEIVSALSVSISNRVSGVMSMLGRCVSNCSDSSS